MVTMKKVRLTHLHHLHQHIFQRAINNQFYPLKFTVAFIYREDLPIVKLKGKILVFGKKPNVNYWDIPHLVVQLMNSLVISRSWRPLTLTPNFSNSRSNLKQKLY